MNLAKTALKLQKTNTHLKGGASKCEPSNRKKLSTML